MDLNGTAVIVTGGASGLGAATARALAASGAKVTILDVNAEAVQKVASEIGGVGVETSSAPVDSSQPEIEKVMNTNHGVISFLNIATKLIRETIPE